MLRQSLTPFLPPLLLMLTAGLLSSPSAPVRPPNVVLILTDDLGYGGPAGAVPANAPL